MRRINSNYFGVRLVRKKGKYVHYIAVIRLNNKPRSITGQYDTSREAAIAYDKVAIRYNMKTNILKQKTK